MSFRESRALPKILLLAVDVRGGQKIASYDPVDRSPPRRHFRRCKLRGGLRDGVVRAPPHPPALLGSPGPLRFDAVGKQPGIGETQSGACAAETRRGQPSDTKKQEKAVFTGLWSDTDTSDRVKKK